MAHSHLVLQPTVVHLKDLPNEGRQYIYTDTSGELTASLQDLIGTQPYRVEIDIKPMGNAYLAQGTIQTGLNEICSLCAVEFVYPVKETFKEFLVVINPLSSKDHQARVNHSSELDLDGPECTELSSEVFQVGEFIHELIAVAAPMKPIGRPDCGPACENYQEAVQKGWLGAQDNAPLKSESPFAVLKDLKLRS